MTTSSPFDGPRPTKPPSPTADEEPLPPTGDGGDRAASAESEASRAGTARSDDETPLVRLSAELSAADGKSFAAGFARRHYFAGARLLKPGRRVAIAVAGVTGLAVMGVGVAAGISRLGGDDIAQAATTVQATAPASAPSTQGPSSGPGRASHRPSEAPKTHSSHKGGESSAQDVVSGLPGTVAAAPGSGTANNSGGGKTTAQGTGTGSGTGSGATGTTQQSTPQTSKTTDKSDVFTGTLLFNFASSRCLATQSGSRAAGTQTVLADCDSGEPAQGWTFPSDGTARNFGGTMCLDVSGSGNGALVRLAKCSSSRAANQRFVLNNSYDLVLAVNPGQCVDAKDKNTAVGTVLQLWSCAGTANQKWRKA
ncbi:RICIN domain-containing protein [Streptomyces sp. NPDC001315]|uniref:RICIN domain-containing protein n=1 Tax=Streptomyces sp. NPDC001315 TaxID=3364562 RepID=UPI0036941389